jgi:RND superfamily putative drug exporter
VVLVVAMLAVVGFGVLGVGAFGKLQTGGFQDPGAGSSTAQTLTGQRFGGSKDGTYALVLGSTRSDTDLSSSELAGLGSRSRPVDVTVGGGAAIGNDITKQVGKSLGIAEGIAVPVILALLVFAFGSVVAALLPLAIGMIAIFGTFAELFLFGSVTNVSIYAINLTTALGLALAIDYALLMISRFREELGRGQDPAGAVVRSVQTAGRTRPPLARTASASTSAAIPLS